MPIGSCGWYCVRRPLVGAVAMMVPSVDASRAAWGWIVVSNAGEGAGLSCTHAPDLQCIPLSLAWFTGGLAVGDFNNDMWPDLFVVGGGDVPDRLYINAGNGTFADQAAGWGLGELHGGCGAAVGDYDKDGWQDIYVTSFGIANVPSQPGKHRLYRNSGMNSFENVAVAAGVNQTAATVAGGFGSAFGDYDLDGDLDLFVACWKDNAGSGNGGTGNKLFRNNGDETFTDVSPSLGGAMAGVWGFQPAFADMDGDLFPELLLAADFGTCRYLMNQHGSFVNFTQRSGTGLTAFGMGQTVGDVNNDGLFDWYVTSIHVPRSPPRSNYGNMLYMNLGEHLYDEASIESGVNDGGWGWGTVAVDLNHDGWLDLIEVNGQPTVGGGGNDPEYLFHNNGDGTFTEIGVAAGLHLIDDARALAILDADRDGDQDFVISVYNGAMRYYRNDTPAIGSWITLTIDTSANPLLPPNGFGTHIVVVTDSGAQTRCINGAPSYLATSELVAHFGLGPASLASTIEVHWTRGNNTTLYNVAANQFLTIHAPPPADVNADGAVNVADLLGVIGAWGLCPAPCPFDVNADAVVNVTDLLLLIGNWG
ncbi:MAG: FG-GAP-like repeat-containing protein [Phycisphaerales bacterium]|nr:FG-GAP-like repeat-containing protein [Phycisphaerales bacterium]